MVRLDNFVVASILMLATRSAVMSAPVTETCTGTSCKLNTPLKRVSSSGSSTTGVNQETEAGGNKPNLNKDVMEVIYKNAANADLKNIRESSKILRTFKPRVWELYCAQTHTDLDSSKARLLVSMYSFCFKEYPVTLKYFPTVKACLDDVDKDAKALAPFTFSYDERKLITTDLFREIVIRGTAPVALGDLLWTTVVNGDIDTIKTLLAYGLDPNLPNYIGHTPLMAIAIMESEDKLTANRVKCAELLLANGADPNIKDPDSLKTALQLAKDCNHQPMVALLSRPSRTK